MKRLEKEEAVKLRLKGKSYNEIIRILQIPSKGTLSYWFRDLQLSHQAKRRLEKNILLAQKRGLFKYNKERSLAIKVENKNIHERASKEIGALTSRELLLVGAALYWGEGTKNESGKYFPSLALANSDPSLIRFYMKFLKKVLDINREKIRASIHVHPNVDIEKAKQFWASITQLPKDRFYIIRQVSRASKFRRPSRALPYGTATIKVNRRQIFFRVRGYIDGLKALVI
ncbi:MAG: hypothetical protein HYT39_00940 [Candidatus Sungbacteria bacterium]|nr:hypothetical protein [Candidatus Sungbacteria bacterium]